VRSPVGLPADWRATLTDPQLERDFADPALDDSGWEPVTVPGHWRTVPAFADSDGPLLYRVPFAAERPERGERAWLVFDGVFYQSDVWLDGGYVGDSEGYFFGHTFEVTDALTAADEHLLAAQVACPPPEDRTAKRSLTGVFQHWDCIDPGLNPGGIWRPVRLERTGPVRLRRLGVVCSDADRESATVRFRAFADNAAPGIVRIHTRIGQADTDAAVYTEELSLAAGENQLEWAVTVPEPRLWWPWSLGDQERYDVVVEAQAEDGAVSHTLERKVGLRSLRFDDWRLSVNGERLFLKGANLAPTRALLGEAGEDDVRRDVDLARDAGLDLVRVHAHVTVPALYDQADERGLLVWQDLPLQWGYARSVRKQAVRQARKAVDVLGHHPSVAIWCGHNEPLALEVPTGDLADPAVLRKVGARTAMAMQLPTWNKTVLDRSIKRALEKADGSRPVIPHSGVWPHLPRLDGTDSHLYFGWYHGDERDLPGFAATIPRLVRFVSEFGAQAVPESAEFCEPERWPDLDWDRLEAHHGLQRTFLDRRVPEAEHATFASWRAATQAYQAELIRHHVEELRRLKYRPTGGFTQFLLTDAQPAVSWSVLDHQRVAKAGYEALTEACRPVIVVADRLPAEVHPGEVVALEIHVVSDLHVPLVRTAVSAELSWPDGHRAWHWEGEVPADSCVRIGRVEAALPEVAGELRLDLTLTAGDVTATNRYTTAVTPA
jgi:beta-mannosidase